MVKPLQNMSIEEIYDMGFTNYISPSKYESMISWNFERWTFGGGKSQIVKARIEELINKSKKVKCGYMCTSIKEAHNYYIIYK